MSDPTGSGERLVQMANDIADYFASEPDRELAIDGIAQHLVRFWEPRMRTRIRALATASDSGLCELAQRAVQRLPATKD